MIASWNTDYLARDKKWSSKLDQQKSVWEIITFSVTLKMDGSGKKTQDQCKHSNSTTAFAV